MQLSRLALTNFRSYKKFNQPLGRTTILVGPNGIGKTNIIEAVYLLAVMKSYRAGSDGETIRFGQEFSKVVGTIQAERPQDATHKPASKAQAASSDELEVIIYQGQKRAKRNGAAKPLSSLIGTFKAVLFSPEQLDIIYGAPRRRRRFLDSLLSQVDHRYTHSLLEYQRALFQRNALLLAIKEGRARLTELYFWDNELIAAGKIIHELRASLLAATNKYLADFYRKIVSQSAPLSITPQLQLLTEEVLERRRSDDVRFAATTAGPHRDNFILKLGSRELALYGSRGEWRSALFALKAAEAEYVTAQTQACPALLFDDVFSELDLVRRDRLFAETGLSQVIITTTDMATLPKYMQGRAQVIEVEKYAQPA